MRSGINKERLQEAADNVQKRTEAAGEDDALRLVGEVLEDALRYIAGTVPASAELVKFTGGVFS